MSANAESTTGAPEYGDALVAALGFEPTDGLAEVDVETAVIADQHSNVVDEPGAATPTLSDADKATASADKDRSPKAASTTGVDSKRKGSRRSTRTRAGKAVSARAAAGKSPASSGPSAAGSTASKSHLNSSDSPDAVTPARTASTSGTTTTSDSVETVELPAGLGSLRKAEGPPSAASVVGSPPAASVPPRVPDATSDLVDSLFGDGTPGVDGDGFTVSEGAATTTAATAKAESAVSSVTKAATATAAASPRVGPGIGPPTVADSRTIRLTPVAETPPQPAGPPLGPPLVEQVVVSPAAPMVALRQPVQLDAVAEKMTGLAAKVPQLLEGGLLQRSRRVRARKVRRVVRHVDPWSVLTFSVLFHLCVFAALLLSSVLVWNAAVAAGTIENIESFIRELGDYTTYEINGDVVFRAAMVIAGILTLASSVLMVLLTVVFNLISDLVGGIRFTVVEEETVRVRRKRNQ